MINTRISTIEKIMLYCMLFPWISFSLNDFDTQPWLIGSCSFYLILKKQRFPPREIKQLAILLFLACLIPLSEIDNNPGLSIRAIGSLVMVILAIYCSWNLTREKNILPIVLRANYIWLLAGVLQFIINKDIFSFLVSVRTSPERGVTGLAPEPTFYGISLYFASWLLLVLTKYKPDRHTKFIIFANILAILLLAQSSMTMLFIAITVLTLALFASIKKPKILALLIITSTAMLFFMKSYFVNNDTSRIGAIFNSIISNPENLIISDQSINERSSHIYFSYAGFFDDFGLPHGPAAFKDYWGTGTANSHGLFWYGTAEKINSGVGTYLFEYGILGFFILYIMCKMIYNKKNKIGSALTIMLLMTLFSSAIPISFPPIAMLIAIFYNQKRLLS